MNTPKFDVWSCFQLNHFTYEKTPIIKNHRKLIYLSFKPNIKCILWIVFKPQQKIELKVNLTSNKVICVNDRLFKLKLKPETKSIKFSRQNLKLKVATHDTPSFHKL